MRRIFIAYLLVYQFGFTQELKYFSESHDFNIGETVYMFGDEVKLRKEPNTNSNIISKLKIGEKIKILEKSNSKMMYEGIDWSWYKIKNNDKIGYILGSFISFEKFTYDSLTYVISLKKDDFTTYLRTRIIKDKNQYVENISPLKTKEFSIKVTGNRDLNNIESIVEVNYLAESCGVDGGGFYLFSNGKELTKVIDFIKISDADLYWYFEEYIFPNEKGGKENKIIYKREVGETKDYETQWVETKSVQCLLDWNGREINPKIEDLK